ncbi:MAG: hypothetical protein ABEJ74_05795 [Haloferacaceae archaeon]
MNVLPPGAPSRFDFLLLAMGLALVVGVAVAALSSVPLRVAGSTASALAGAAMVDGLVWHPPNE